MAISPFTPLLLIGLIACGGGEDIRGAWYAPEGKIIIISGGKNDVCIINRGQYIGGSGTPRWDEPFALSCVFKGGEYFDCEYDITLYYTGSSITYMGILYRREMPAGFWDN